MNNRERADALKGEADILYDHSWELQEKAGALMKARLQTLLDVLKEEKILSQCKWRFDRFAVNYLYLVCKGTWNDLKGIRELLCPEYHEHYMFSDDVRLWFSDGDVGLELTRETAEDFVVAHGLTIDVSDLKERLTKRESEVQDLKELISLMECLNLAREAGLE